MSEDQKRQLEQQLWNIADELRGRMNADEFRDYALGFIFYKYLSEKISLYANKILKEDNIFYDQIDETTEEGQQLLEFVKEDTIKSLGYFLKPSELFKSLAKRGAIKSEKDEAKDEGNGEKKANFILGDLASILNNIEQSTMGSDSEEDFDNLFEDLDLTSSKLGKNESQKNELIGKILGHLDKIDFKLGDSNSDILGDAYEYLIGQFAAGAGKKAGEFYTPQPVSKVLAKLVTVGKTKLKSVYDPTCGSGSLLLRVNKEVQEVANFYGQELNRTTYNLARMNMILHDVHYSKFDIRLQNQKINELSEKLNSSNTTTNTTSIGSTEVSSGCKLFQNNPNPFNNSTEIKSVVLDKIQTANLYIYDMNGAQQKNIVITSRGTVITEVSASSLKAGLYYYTLVCDGQEIDTKKMIITQ